MDSRVSELQAKFTGVTAQTTRNPNQTFLIRRITEATPWARTTGPT